LHHRDQPNLPGRPETAIRWRHPGLPCRLGRMESRRLRLRDRPNLLGRTGSHRSHHRAQPCRPVHTESGRWHRQVLRSRCLRTGCRQRGHTEAEEEVPGLHPQSAIRQWQLPQRPRTVGTLSSSALRSRRPTTTNVGCRNPSPTEPRAGAQPEVVLRSGRGRNGCACPARNTGDTPTAGCGLGPRATRDTGPDVTVGAGPRAGSARNLGTRTLGTGRRCTWRAIGVEARCRRRWRRVIGNRDRRSGDRGCRGACEQNWRHFRQFYDHAIRLPRSRKG
jgi:hypothetical protein